MSTHTLARERAATAPRAVVRPSATQAKASVVALMLLVGVLGLWGMQVMRGPSSADHDGHPRPGDALAFEGGVLVVDDVHDVDLSLPMTGPGMKMGPSSGVPDIPDGYRWLSVDLSIESADGYRIEPDLFLVTEHGRGSAPVALDEGGSVIPPGASLARSFTYQVPEDVQSLEFWAPGSEVPVMLTLGDAPAPHEHH